MRSRAVLFLLMGCACFSTAAQSDTTGSKADWFISLHSGILTGTTGRGSSVTTALVQGVRYHTFSIGVGVGYDGYLNWQVLPVFASLGWDFAERKDHAWFVQVSTGYSKAWNAFEEQQQLYFRDEGGFFYHPAIGYRLHQGKLTIYLTAGYKLQRLHYKVAPRWSGWGGAGLRSSVEQDMERLSIQMGIGLW